MTLLDDITERLSMWGQSLAGIARTGLSYTKNCYDVERYEEVLRLASEIVASINSGLEVDKEFANDLSNIWHREVESGDAGYATPKVSVGAIVFNEREELLLVRNATNKHWCFPVGFAEIGYTPSEVARKEVFEETGLEVKPLYLMGVADSFHRKFNTAIHVYNLLFYCQLQGGKLGSRTEEVDDVGFFLYENLPAKLVVDGEPWIKDAFDWHANIDRQPYFD